MGSLLEPVAGVGRIDNKHERIGLVEIMAPQWDDHVLAPDIEAGEGQTVRHADSLHVETDCGNGGRCGNGGSGGGGLTTGHDGLVCGWEFDAVEKNGLAGGVESEDENLAILQLGSAEETLEDGGDACTHGVFGRRGDA